MAKDVKAVSAVEADPWDAWAEAVDAKIAKLEQMLGLSSPVEAKDDPASDPVEDGKAGE